MNASRLALSNIRMRAIAFLALGATAFAATETVLPEPFAKVRYDQTRSNSPFVLATPVVPVAVVQETKFTENMYVIGLGRADGQEYVSIVRLGEESQPIRLLGKAPNSDGIALHEIVWSDAFGKSRVKLVKAGVTEEIGFSENAAKVRASDVPAVTPAKANKSTVPPVGGKPPRIRVIK